MNSSQRRELLGYLGSGFGPQVRVVLQPDHPLLISGPDLLIGDAEHLLGVFLPSVRELRQLALLTARLTLSRLAYPSNLRTALVSDDDFPAKIARDFSSVIPTRDRLRLRRALTEDDQRHRDLPGDVVTLVNERFANVMSRPPEELFRFEAMSNGGRSFDFPGSENVAVRIPRSLERTDTGLILHVETAPSRAAASARLEHAIRYSALEDFELDRGVPYPRHDLLPIRRIVGRLDTLHTGFDRRKPVRAAAFAGYWSETEGD